MDSDSDIEVVPSGSKSTQPESSQAAKQPQKKTSIIRKQQTEKPPPRNVLRKKLPSLSPDPLAKILSQAALATRLAPSQSPDTREEKIADRATGKSAIRSTSRLPSPSPDPFEEKTTKRSDVKKGKSVARVPLLSPDPFEHKTDQRAAVKSGKSVARVPSLSPDPSVEKTLKRSAGKSLSPIGSFKDNGRSAKRVNQSAPIPRDLPESSSTHVNQSASVPIDLHDSSLSPVVPSPPASPQHSSPPSSPALPEPLQFSPMRGNDPHRETAQGPSRNRSKSPSNLIPSQSSLHSNPAPISKSTATRIEKQAQAAQARLLREAKKAAKEKEKMDNRLQREANKLTLNRKETVAEVQMFIPKSLQKSKLHPMTKACEVLEQRIASTEGCMMKQPVEIDDEASEPKGVVRWVRTSTKEWDEDRGIFIPLGVGVTKDTSEPTVLVVWTGKEVDEVIAAGNGQLTKKVQAIKSSFPDDQLFIVIYGLETILRAERRMEDARVSQDARAKLAAQRNEPMPGPSRSKKNSSLPHNGRDAILRELEMMKILTKAFVIRVEDKNEFANWLWEMTMEIGVRPYKSRKQELKSALRLEMGGNKGANHEDTYIKMLSSMTRVTENEAKGIVAKFPTLKSLYRAWEQGIQRHGLPWAEDMLVGCSKTNPVTSVNAPRKIGKVTSKRIFEIMYQTRNGDAVL
ncbi:hypothetical protein PCANC_11864 [Puccinia coronata f. sp. avenae]|uniref:Uncharacterized protein n=1 Tax=Puccinia coronata f. sp. avenae TaxID=200324 RepID=A0A2N5SUZ3_9BASI|nr:hypothetical protein PCANC_11864 [Puccinia coronata f. sp. avenae]